MKVVMILFGHLERTFHTHYHLLRSISDVVWRIVDDLEITIAKTARRLHDAKRRRDDLLRVKILPCGTPPQMFVNEDVLA